MLYPQRELTKHEDDLILAISNAVYQRFAPQVRKADAAVDTALEVEIAAHKELRANPRWQEIQAQLKNSGDGRLKAIWSQIGGGDDKAGYRVFKQEWGALEEPHERAKAALSRARNELEKIGNAQAEEESRVIAVTFARIAYQAAIATALDAFAANDMASLLRSRAYTPATVDAYDTTVAGAVESLLASSDVNDLVAAGGER